MTTIAWDGKSLAADSRATESDGSARTDRFRKVHRIQSKVQPLLGEVLVASAGCEFAGELFMQWMKRGGVPDLHARGIEDDDEGESPLDVMVIHKSGAYVANHLGCFIKVRDGFWAHGTGRQGALVAMDMGASAAEAVKRVMKFENNTGGRVVSMRLGKK